jgi:signal transduction histidine kinase
MTPERGLTRRLGRELLLQAVYISVAVIVGVYVVAVLLEDVLIEQALEGEAEYYWQRVAEQPDAVLPDTLNLTAYREGLGQGVPTELAQLGDGFHKRSSPRETLTFITTRDGHRLYLVFESGQVNELVTTFGVVPLALALTVIYLALFSAYRVSRRAVSPLVDLARRVQRLDPTRPDAQLFSEASSYHEDEETRVLAEALQELVSRVTEFTERERRFTRDASHELRTPLTVISIAADKLLRQPGLDDSSRESLERIKGSARDMEKLTAAFLLLARESNSALVRDLVSVNEMVRHELDRAQLINPDSPVTLEIEEQCQLLVPAPEKVLESMVGNLLRNALAYTDRGQVKVIIAPGSVVIEDTGPGMEPEQVEQLFQPFYRGQRQRGGYGVGLTIVKRLSDRFGWPVHIESEPGRGTRVRVEFPDAHEG